MKKSLSALYNADRLLGLVFFIIGTAGFLVTLLAKWRSGPGYGPRLFPQVAFILMIVCGVLLTLSTKTGGERKLLAGNEVKSLALLVGSGFLYFQAVLRIGLVVSTFLYVSALFAVLTPSPVRNWKLVVVPGLIATVLIWAMFSTLIKLILPPTLLF